MAEARRKPRADALRNRRRLVEAAKEVLGRGGPEASLEAVARAAGVGIGTLYRNFPTREALFQAVYRHEVEQLIALAGDLDSGDRVADLRAWTHALIGLVATKRGLLGALAVVPMDASRAMYDESQVQMKAAVGGLISAGIADGALRADAEVEDLLSTIYGLCHASPPEPGWEARVLRLIDIFIDGLRAR
ncbi:MAG: TetR/AcrR family transcriptional regulator [Pseudooceanicola nanhaiensis]